jgi:hypothetical protein
MAQIIEVPGMGNVEFPDEMSEHEIADAIDAQLNKQSEGPVSAEDAIVAGGAIAPKVIPGAVKAIASGPGAVGNAYNATKAVVGPTVSGAGRSGLDLVKAYASNPGTLAGDVAASHLGLPPPTAAAKAQPLYEGLNKSYQAVQDYLGKTGQFAPKTPATPAGQQAGGNMAGQSGAVAPDPQMAQASQMSNQITGEQLVKHMNANQSQEQLANQLAQQKQTQQIVQTQGTSALEGSNFMKTIQQKFAPMAEAVSPYLQKAGPMLDTAVKGFNKVAIPAMIAHELFYTSPEERAILQKAEAEKRAKGWKPINER